MFNKIKGILKSDFAYEARPFLCLFGAIYSFKKVQYPLPGVAFGVMLLFAAATIFYFRAGARGFFKSK